MCPAHQQLESILTINIDYVAITIIIDDGCRAQQEGKVGYQQGQEVLGPLITLARVEDPALAHALGCHLRGQQSVICRRNGKSLCS